MDPVKPALEVLPALRRKLKEYSLDNDSLSVPMREQLAEYRNDDDFLIKFLIGRKYDVEHAFRSIVKYTEGKILKYPELFTNEVPPCVKIVLDDGVISIVKNRDKLGRALVFLRASNMNPSKLTVDDLICAGKYVAEELMHSHQLLEDGGYIVLDCSGGTLRHARYITVSAVTKFLHLFWQSYPCKMKGLYFINTPAFIRPMYQIFKRFIPGKLKDRLLFTTGVNELHERFDRDLLPECLGGPLPDEEGILQFYPRSGAILDINEFVPSA